MTSIEWTDKSWNPIVGCSIVSPGCTNCYAMKMAARLEAVARKSAQRIGIGGSIAAVQYLTTTKKVKGIAVWSGHIAQAPEATLLEPLRRKKPTMYFVNSMGDLFHEDIPDEWIDRVFAVMAQRPQHTFQVLTKRAERMRKYVDSHRYELNIVETAERMVSGVNLDAAQWPPHWPLPNCWLGVSTEDQARADERIPLLLQTPAAIRFISAEPLIGPIDLNYINPIRLADGSGKYLKALYGGVTHRSASGYADYEGERANTYLRIVEETPKLDWVIVGGESGHDARPMHPSWARSLRDQCIDARVPFFFKQWGSWSPETIDGTEAVLADLATNQIVAFGDGQTNYVRLTRISKKAAGRKLDGKEHNEFPKAKAGEAVAA